MTDTVLLDQEAVILLRKTERAEKSYTCYLFDSGIDKILKKVGEECTETVIAAKNLKHALTFDAPEEEKITALKADLTGEVADLLYHVQVMLADTGVSINDVLCEVDKRSEKVGNKKEFKTVDKNS